MIFVDWDYSWLFLFVGLIYFLIMYGRYRNSGARHTYETQTKKEISNLKEVDRFIRSETGLTNSSMEGANNMRINGQTSANKLTSQNIGNSVINSAINGSSITNIIKDNINKNGK